MAEFGAVATKVSVHDRIRRKKAVLKEWLERGIPKDKIETLPDSLRSARTWEDEDLGLSAIGSFSHFSKNHPVFGGDVADIAMLLEKLNARYRRPKAKPSSGRAVVSKIERRDREAKYAAAVSDWHQLREELASERKRADKLERDYNAKLKEKDAEIAQLRSRIAQLSGLSVVE